ncbi:cspLB [Symbiodinium sp. KB8]|nr:cspLB [Symbiodinium sp. KB8]|eukprot:CAMPEP_0181484696 /NCGR_PEP_ID=MMETSP1110-20121109/46143_1 /TAXON_ID=174948 /ORGANISM="Symbiodinium sp., Strain CCMP421" /LENGTH=208 /DNA_ID=CAMNT_0023610593 /DNA_START=51 /DNA_END=677 /DNA_ORIENTATION=-
MTSQGSCKSFNGFKGWGFIDYNGQDVFVHIRDCQGGQPAPGDMLTFDLEESQPGKFKAKNVVGGTAERDQDSMMGKATPVQGTGAHTGTVKSFNATKGFGFICIEGADDVFVHTKSCVGTLPNAGDVVKFDMEPSPNRPGQFQAVNVTGGTAPMSAMNPMGMMGKGGFGPMIAGIMGGLKGGMMVGGMGPYGKGKGGGGYGGYGGYGW